MSGSTWWQIAIPRALKTTDRGALVTKDAVHALFASFGKREWQRLTNPEIRAEEYVCADH